MREPDVGAASPRVAEHVDSEVLASCGHFVPEGQPSEPAKPLGAFHAGTLFDTSTDRRNNVVTFVNIFNPEIRTERVDLADWALGEKSVETHPASAWPIRTNATTVERHCQMS